MISQADRVVIPLLDSGSGGSMAAISDDRAGSVPITTVADQFVTYSSAITGSYVLTVWFMDQNNVFATIPVNQSDWLGSGFWLRSGLIPLYPPDTTSGTLYYIAKKAT